MAKIELSVVLQAIADTKAIRIADGIEKPGNGVA